MRAALPPQRLELFPDAPVDLDAVLHAPPAFAKRALRRNPDFVGGGHLRCRLDPLQRGREFAAVVLERGEQGGSHRYQQVAVGPVRAAEGAPPDAHPLPPWGDRATAV